MKEKKQRKSKIFILFMVLYVCLWISATAYASGWVWDQAMNYQERYDTAKKNSQPELFMDEFVKSVDAKKLTEWMEEDGSCNISSYSAEGEYENYFEKIIGNKDISYEKTDVKNMYKLKAGSRTIAEVKIGSNNEFDEFNFSGWKFIDAEVLSFMYETFSKTIVADKNYKVYVNGKELTKEYKIREKVTAMGQHVSSITGELYGTDIYKIEGFLVEPEIYAVDKNGNKVQNTSVEIDMAEFVKDEVSQIDFDKKGRVTDTLYMYFEHMNKLKKYEDMKTYLLAGTDVFDLIASAQQSIKWVTPVKKITFVEEDISDYVLYNDTYFSCNVYLNVQKDYGYTIKNEYFDAVVLFKKVNNQWYWDTFMLN